MELEVTSYVKLGKDRTGLKNKIAALASQKTLHFNLSTRMLPLPRADQACIVTSLKMLQFK